MSKTLVVVESPAKARKIQKYLGSKYIVKASFGHILDLPSRKLGVDLKSPDFPLEIVPIPGKQKVIRELKKAYKQCNNQVILAPDPDREGEAIGYYTAVCLGASPYEVPRISFQEITQKAIMSAIKHPQTLCESSVKAQMARRALDRILGYKISPLVRKQTYTGKSAGRCQSPSLLILRQKEDEIKDFFDKNDTDSKTIRSKMIGMVEGDPTPWEVVCSPMPGFPKVNWMEVDWKVSSVKKGEVTKTNPPPPFITSSLLSTAASRLGYGTGRTKKMIQQMYEKGWITYIRTDSTAISKDAQTQIANYLKEELNVPVVMRGWGQKKAGSHAQEAHECIRPTLIKRLADDVDSDYKRLYELIWNRTVASQMEASESITVSIEVKRKTKLVWKGSKSYCVKAGWKQIEGVEEIKSSDIPLPKKNAVWTPTSIVVEEVYSNPPHRYNDATFVSRLEKLGIGRPSTYATIVETIQARGYAEVKDIDGMAVQCRRQEHKKGKELKTELIEQKVGNERKRLCITDLGNAVCDFLYPNAEDLLGIKATSKMESLLDNICSGKSKYELIMKDYWDQLSSTLDVLTKVQSTKKPEAPSSGGASGRILGTQTIDGKDYTISVEITRYGPAVTRSFGDEKKEYGNIPKGTIITDLTLEDAIRHLPLSLGTWKRKKVIAKKGKFGPYLQVGKDMYVSIPKEDWDAGMTKKRAQELLQKDEKEKAHAKSLTSSLKDSGVKEILKGPKGWYAKMVKGRKSVSIGDSILDQSIDTLSQRL